MCFIVLLWANCEWAWAEWAWARQQKVAVVASQSTTSSFHNSVHSRLLTYLLVHCVQITCSDCQCLAHRPCVLWMTGTWMSLSSLNKLFITDKSVSQLLCLYNISGLQCIWHKTLASQVIISVNKCYCCCNTIVIPCRHGHPWPTHNCWKCDGRFGGYDKVGAAEELFDWVSPDRQLRTCRPRRWWVSELSNCWDENIVVACLTWGNLTMAVAAAVSNIVHLHLMTTHCQHNGRHPS